MATNTSCILLVGTSCSAHLIDLARKKRENDNFEIKGKVYASDSSTIDLCLSVFLVGKVP